MSARRKEEAPEPPRWDEARLTADLEAARADFRTARMKEPLEAYLEEFENARDAFDELMEETVDLTRLADKAAELLTDPKKVDAIRYLAGPPISADDLKTLAEASLAPKRIEADPEMAQRIIQTVLLGLDRRRFPWLEPGNIRDATETERASAVLASSALVATQRLATARRHEEKTKQEDMVKQALKEIGFVEVPTREIQTLADAPNPGEFCGECLVAGRKADIPVGLWDNRLMPVECKVSNSETNSIKRLNNDAAVKAVEWTKALGQAQVVPTAVLSGVYSLKSLTYAQERGLALFWAHDLSRMMEWIQATKA